MVRIWLDGGHGGKDPGATGNGILEKNIVLEIAKIMEKELKANYENVEIRQSRNDDSFVSLSDRTSQANLWNADAFVSIHINSATNTSAKGFETHIYTNVDDRTKAFQNVMHDEITRQIRVINGITDRGKKQSNFHVLRESKMIAILSENLFISNPQDASLLKQQDFLNKLAIGHVVGLEKFFGLKKKQVSVPIPEQTNNTSSANELYQVIAGTFSNKENADKQAEKLKSAGYSVYVFKKQ